MTLRFLFAWYDLWVGCYWDRRHRDLYVLPIPMCGFVLHFHRWEPSELIDGEMDCEACDFLGTNAPPF